VDADGEPVLRCDADAPGPLGDAPF
jgi:hypothetical protein